MGKAQECPLNARMGRVPMASCLITLPYDGISPSDTADIYFATMRGLRNRPQNCQPRRVRGYYSYDAIASTSFNLSICLVAYCLRGWATGHACAAPAHGPCLCGPAASRLECSLAGHIYMHFSVIEPVHVSIDTSCTHGHEI